MQHTLNYQPEWIEMINTLPDTNERNALIAAITMYQYNGLIPELSPALQLVFLFIKKEIDSILQKQKEVEARKEARRLKRIKTTRQAKEAVTPNANKQLSEKEATTLPQSNNDFIQQPIQEAKAETQRHAETSAVLPSQDTRNQEPPQKKGSKFNSLLRAKEKHDRNRLKNRNHRHR